MEELPTGRLVGAVSLRFRWNWVNAEMQQENVCPRGVSFLPRCRVLNGGVANRPSGWCCFLAFQMEVGQRRNVAGKCLP